VRRAALLAAVAAALAAATAAGPAEARRGPLIRQMVVFRSGEATAKRVRARRVLVRIHGKRCAAGTSTALAALWRGRPSKVKLRDFGTCSLHARDGAGLFVGAIGHDHNHGQDGWVYKVGRKAATAGAADPGGPFGHGGLRSGQRVLWFFCKLGDHGCQRSLAIRTSTQPGQLTVRVIGYDDEGHGKGIAGATVQVGSTTALSDASGLARVQLTPGRYKLFARKEGLVRSFSERVSVP
jgi:hypothetical protein